MATNTSGPKANAKAFCCFAGYTQGFNTLPIGLRLGRPSLSLDWQPTFTLPVWSFLLFRTLSCGSYGLCLHPVNTLWPLFREGRNAVAGGWWQGKLS